MKKIIILGSTGMLGGYVARYFSGKYDITKINRDKLDATLSTTAAWKLFTTLQLIGCTNSTVVNCIGMIKPQVDKYGVLQAIAVNSVFPRLLEEYCKIWKANLIHITTDCVFSGKKGPYNEKSPHDALDVYGKTKSLGEPEDSSVIRTSIIGEEKVNKRSLVEWIKSSKGKTVNGYTNHLWNGVTCLQLAKVMDFIIENDAFWKGVRNLYSPTPVTKLELVNLVSEVYDLGITVNPTLAPEPCDRTLSSVYNECISFNIPELRDQILEMKNFSL